MKPATPDLSGAFLQPEDLTRADAAGPAAGFRRGAGAGAGLAQRVAGAALGGPRPDRRRKRPGADPEGAARGIPAFRHPRRLPADPRRRDSRLGRPRPARSDPAGHQLRQPRRSLHPPAFGRRHGGALRRRLRPGGRSARRGSGRGRRAGAFPDSRPAGRRPLCRPPRQRGRAGGVRPPGARLWRGPGARDLAAAQGLVLRPAPRRRRAAARAAGGHRRPRPPFFAAPEPSYETPAPAEEPAYEAPAYEAPAYEAPADEAPAAAAEPEPEYELQTSYVSGYVEELPQADGYDPLATAAEPAAAGLRGDRLRDSGRLRVACLRVARL